MKIPPAGQSWLGKRISSLINEDVKVMENGSVKGTLKHVTKYVRFNESDIEEQSGHYFPFVLTGSGEKMTIKINGVAREDKTNLLFDPEIIIRVRDKDTTCTIEVDGKEVITLNFAEAILA